MTAVFPNLIKQISSSSSAKHKHKSMRKTTPRYMIIKCLKTNNKEKILKGSPRRAKVRRTADFLY